MNYRTKAKVPKKIFLVGKEKLGEKEKRKVEGLWGKYPSLKGLYWAKEVASSWDI